MDRAKKRILKNKLNEYLMLLAAGIIVFLFITILVNIIAGGISAFNIDLFTNLPKAPGKPGGGIAQAIIGSIIMVSVATLLSVPFGLGAGLYIYLKPDDFVAKTTKFVTNLLASVPSIVVGVFVWAIVVRSITGFSAIAGSIALAILMIPIISRGTEEVLRKVPQEYVKTGLELGITPWRVTVFIVLKSMIKPLSAVTLFAGTRALGETAPLLLTALGNEFFNFNLLRPMGAVTLEIYNYALSPYKDWQAIAWAGSLVLILITVISQGVLLYVSRER